MKKLLDVCGLEEIGLKKVEEPLLGISESFIKKDKRDRQEEEGSRGKKEGNQKERTREAKERIEKF